MKRRLRSLLVLLVGGASMASLARAQLPTLELGVGTHFGLGSTDAQRFWPWVEASTLTSMRDEILWSDVEREPGSFVLRGRAAVSAAALAHARRSGMRPLLILGYGNPLYDGGSQPSSDAGRKAFAAYAAWLARTLGDDVSYLEIWNEWNLGAGTRPRQKSGSPGAYVALLAEARAAIRAVRPDLRVLAGGMGGDGEGWPWLRAAIAAGLLQHADGISVHLYNHAGPRAGGGVPEFLARLSALHDILVAAHKPLPIYVTETGWPNHRGVGRIEPDDAAQRAVRLVLELERRPYVAGLWFYVFHDGGPNAAESEHNFGLLTANYEEKPIGCRLRTVIPLLRAPRERSQQKSGVHIEERATPQGRLLVLWREAGRDCGSTELAIKGQRLSVRPLAACGLPSARVRGDASELRVELKSSPVLLLLAPDAQLDDVAVSAGWIDGLADTMCSLPTRLGLGH